MAELMPTAASVAVTVEMYLRQWLPAGCYVRAAANADYPVMPEEAAVVARAVPQRRQEFHTGRWLARQGLRVFGYPDQPILSGRLRNPLWPAGLLGTISHDGAVCAVALLPLQAADVAGIGIDLVALERGGQVEGLRSMFVVDDAELAGMAGFPCGVDPGLILFSLKEAAIKALTHKLDGFIDLRTLAIRRPDGFVLQFAGETIPVRLFAALAGTQLVTAALIA